jgi:hypothetical protein
MGRFTSYLSGIHRTTRNMKWPLHGPDFHDLTSTEIFRYNILVVDVVVLQVELERSRKDGCRNKLLPSLHSKD